MKAKVNMKTTNLSSSSSTCVIFVKWCLLLFNECVAQTLSKNNYTVAPFSLFICFWFCVLWMCFCVLFMCSLSLLCITRLYFYVWSATDIVYIDTHSDYDHEFVFFYQLSICGHFLLTEIIVLFKDILNSIE